MADARRRLGVTLKEDILPKALAERAGVPASTVTRIEGGLTAPTEATLVKLAAALGVSPAWLRYGDPVAIEEPSLQPLPRAPIKQLAAAEEETPKQKNRRTKGRKPDAA